MVNGMIPQPQEPMAQGQGPGVLDPEVGGNQQEPMPQAGGQAQVSIDNDPAKVKQDFMRYVAKATKMIFSEETQGSVVSMLKRGDPVEATAKVTVLIMSRVDGGMREAGLEIADSVKVFAGTEIIGMISEVAEAARVFKLNKELQLLATAVATQDYVNQEVKAGRIDKKALSTQMQQDLRNMPEKQRNEALRGTQSIQMIAKKYNGGNGSISTKVGGKKQQGMMDRQPVAPPEEADPATNDAVMEEEDE